MWSTNKPARPGHRGVARGHRSRFALHYLEMVLVMLVGMLVLGAVLRVALATVGVAYSMDRFPELVILEMGVAMALAMSAWMRHRGHGWPATLDMCAAMLGPALGVAPLVWLGVLAGGAAMVLLHVVMLPLMLVAMLRRRDEYVTPHRIGRHSEAGGA
ncbi:hypothetical protein GCM10029963_23640 [Micromonospora andamanensis]|uniref:hypothetical protein n=1 Tax=Micromonospora andamanensis TaxID=1287068 RepID=UPI00194DE533|nr:hypothetical protein [Micromonospora andamanensis]GIJ38265.1 hypothetical protein Vwe01_15900 [Micromonospora andamanensis]